MADESRCPMNRKFTLNQVAVTFSNCGPSLLQS